MEEIQDAKLAMEKARFEKEVEKKSLDQKRLEAEQKQFEK